MPIMGIEPTKKNAIDCESSVLTTMLERIVALISSYIKYVFKYALKVDKSHTKFSIPYSEFSFWSIADSR